MFCYSGESISGFIQGYADEQLERKQELRHDTRRPIEETIAELGEGRGQNEFTSQLSYWGATANYLSGIYGPGYRQRRAQRLKEAYGIDVPSA